MSHIALVTQELLKKELEKHGYQQSKMTPGFWKHKWRPISFLLVVDDFGVKYVGKKHITNLTNALKENYQISQDWTGSKYCGLELDWDYARREVHIRARIRRKGTAPLQAQHGIKTTIPVTPACSASIRCKSANGDIVG